MKHLFFVLSSLVMSISATAQDFEGKVLFEISLGKDVDPQVQQMMPKESVMYVKDGKTRVEMTMGMGMKNITISDSKEKKAIVLMDMMGQKYAIKKDLSDDEKGTDETKVTVTKETKTIAGYKVTKAIIEMPVKDQKETTKMDVWFTKDLALKSSYVAGASGKIDGAVLEYSVNQKGISMKFTAKQVTKESVENAKFEVPEGYKVTTQEELMKSMGGGK
jgi:hypothetical protein